MRKEKYCNKQKGILIILQIISNLILYEKYNSTNKTYLLQLLWENHINSETLMMNYYIIDENFTTIFFYFREISCYNAYAKSEFMHRLMI